MATPLIRDGSVAAQKQIDPFAETPEVTAARLAREAETARVEAEGKAEQAERLAGVQEAERVKERLKEVIRGSERDS